MVSTITYALTCLAFLAYALNCVAYIYRLRTIARGRKYTVSLLLGSVLVITGYLLMTVAKAKESGESEQTEESEQKPSYSWEACGAGVLALFFISSFFIGTNVTVQLYDPFAAVGYTSLLISNLIQSGFFKYVGPASLVVYYAWGGVHKIGDVGFTNRAQLLGRAALAVYYAELLWGLVV